MRGTDLETTPCELVEMSLQGIPLNIIDVTVLFEDKE